MAPMKAAANTVYIWPLVISPFGATIFFANNTMLQKRNKMVKPLERPDITFTIRATCETSPKAKREKTVRSSGTRVLPEGAQPAI